MAQDSGQVGRAVPTVPSILNQNDPVDWVSLQASRPWCNNVDRVNLERKTGALRIECCTGRRLELQTSECVIFDD